MYHKRSDGQLGSASCRLRASDDGPAAGKFCSGNTTHAPVSVAVTAAIPPFAGRRQEQPSSDRAVAAHPGVAGGSLVAFQPSSVRVEPQASTAAPGFTALSPAAAAVTAAYAAAAAATPCRAAPPAGGGPLVIGGDGSAQSAGPHVAVTRRKCLKDGGSPENRRQQECDVRTGSFTVGSSSRSRSRSSSSSSSKSAHPSSSAPTAAGGNSLFRLVRHLSYCIAF